jgi:hypothetical protein
MERNTIVVADALEWCRSLEAGSVDVWWSSPEYNLADPFRSGGNQSGTRRPRFTYVSGTGRGDGNARDEGEYQAEQVAVLTEWHRTLAHDGVAFYNHKVRIKGGRAISPLEWIYRTPFVILQELVWNRRGTPNVDPCRFLPVSERIYILTKRPFLKLNNPTRMPDVLEFPRMLHKRAESGHPCPTHPAVVRACLSVVPRPEGSRSLVADCYMGTGTTALQAEQLGMDYIGCDRTPEYVVLAHATLAPLPLMQAAG